MTNCAYLTDSSILSCHANLKLYVPSLSELDHFCTNSEHATCPLFHCKTTGVVSNTKRADATGILINDEESIPR